MENLDTVIGDIVYSKTQFHFGIGKKLYYAEGSGSNYTYDITKARVWHDVTVAHLMRLDDQFMFTRMGWELLLKEETV